MSVNQTQIQSNTAQPKSAESDGQRGEQFPLSEQIAADRYLTEQAVPGNRLAIRLFQMRPGSAVGPTCQH